MLSLFRLHLAIFLQSNRLDFDETASLGGFEASDLVHTRFALVVQLLRLRRPAHDDAVALVQPDPDLAIDAFLGLDDACFEELTFRREVQTIVEDTGPTDGDELVAESTDFAVQGESFEIHVCRTEDGQTRGLITAAALQADEAIFDNIDAADAVFPSQCICSEKQVSGVGLGALGGGRNLDGQAFLEVDKNIFGLVGSGHDGIGGQLPHISWWGGVRVLQDTGFVTAVSQILIHTPWLGLCGCDWNSHLGGVVQKVIAALKSLVEFGNSPRCDDLDRGLERIESQLKADLIIALAGAAVRDELAAFFLCDLDLGASDDRASKRCAEEVDILVRGVALDSWKTELTDKLVDDIFDWGSQLAAEIVRRGGKYRSIALHLSSRPFPWLLQSPLPAQCLP